MEKKIDDRSEDHVTINAYKIGASEASWAEVMTVPSKIMLFVADTHTQARTNRKTG